MLTNLWKLRTNPWNIQSTISCVGTVFICIIQSYNISIRPNFCITLHIVIGSVEKYPYVYLNLTFLKIWIKPWPDQLYF